VEGVFGQKEIPTHENDGGDGGELNSPSKRDRSEHATSLVSLLSRPLDLN